MAITVHHGKEEVTVHNEATKWVIDEEERLHIVAPSGNVASYNRGYWANVQRDQ